MRVNETSDRSKSRLLYATLAVAAIFTLATLPASSKEPGIYIQWLFSYQFGLIKRGLIGTVLLNGVYPSRLVATSQLFRLSLLVSLATMGLYAAWALRIWRRRRPDSRDFLEHLMVVGLLIATPIGVVYYVANSQYMEVVLVLLLAIFCHVLCSRPARTIALPVLFVCCLASALVHEEALLSTVPVMLAGYYVSYASARPADRRVLAPLAAVYGLCLLLVLIAGARTGSMAAPITQHIISRHAADLPLDLHYSQVLDRSLTDNLRFTFGEYSRYWNGSRIVLAFVVVLPAIVFLSRRLLDKYPRRIGRMLVAVGLLPLGLAVIADDVFRWYVLIVIGLGSLNLVHTREALARSDEEVPVRVRGSQVGFGMIALLAAVLPFPFFPGDAPNPLLPAVMRIWVNLRVLF
jgi:hypothetical protein